MAELNTAQTIFFGFVVLGLIGLAVWTALPDRKQPRDSSDPKCCDESCPQNQRPER